MQELHDPFGLGSLDVGDIFDAALKSAADRIDPPASPHLMDPSGWVASRLGEHVWSKQRQIMESVRDNRYTTVPSCHSAGKSHISSRIMAWWIDAHLPGEAFIVSTAPTTHQVESILWRLLRRAHNRAKLPGRITLDARYYLPGDELVGYGRKPADYDPDAFQGIHQRYILVVIDEANGVPEVIFNAVDSIASNKNARVLAIGNPDSPTSHFERICRPGSGWNKIQISAFDTPNFTDEWVPEALSEELVSTEWVEERKRTWGEESPIYQSKVLAKFPNISEDHLIHPYWIERAQRKTIKPPAWDYGTMGWDIARYGDDFTVAYRQRAGRLRLLHKVHNSSTTETAGHIAKKIRDFDRQCPAIIDVVGVGAGVVDILTEQDAPIFAFNGGWAAADDERFYNARSEMYWLLREQFEKDAVDMDPADEQLAAELGNIKWGVDLKGRIKVESKDDYKKRTLLKSPDHADGAAYAFVPYAELDLDMDSHTSGSTLTGNLLNQDF